MCNIYYYFFSPNPPYSVDILFSFCSYYSTITIESFYYIEVTIVFFIFFISLICIIIYTGKILQMQERRLNFFKVKLIEYVN